MSDQCQCQYQIPYGDYGTGGTGFGTRLALGGTHEGNEVALTMALMALTLVALDGTGS